MSTWFVSLVVVGAAIAVVTRAVIGDLEKPATHDRQRHRAGRAARAAHAAPPDRAAVRGAPPEDTPRDAPPDEPGEVSTARRARSGVLLALLVVALGALAAIVIGLASIVLVTGLRQAVR